ncbi:flavodoxin family protein [Thermodesulfobacteriota bacterium]
MVILGFMGSPRLKGKCSKLIQKALEGAASKGAETKLYPLIKQNIKYCMGCGNCYTKNAELPIGNCPLKDDMHSILEEYLKADGYFYASPVYDMFVTALSKTFLERKIALTFKAHDEVAKIPSARRGVAANFMKKASFIVTGNCGDEYEEVMGDPCYEAFEAHLMFEEIDTLDKLYVGSVEDMSDDQLNERLEQAFQLGVNMVETIESVRKAD